MKGDAEKCHLNLNKNKSVDFQLSGSLTQKSNCEKMWGLKIDCKLTFHEHVKTLCGKVNNTLTSLASAASYMSVEGKKMLMNSFFNAQFHY